MGKADPALGTRGLFRLTQRGASLACSKGSKHLAAMPGRLKEGVLLNRKTLAGIAICALLVACSAPPRGSLPQVNAPRVPSDKGGVPNFHAAQNAWSGPLPPPASQGTLGPHGLYPWAHGFHPPSARPSKQSTGGAEGACYLGESCPNSGPTGGTTNVSSYSGGYVGHQPNLAIVTWGFSANDATKDPYGEANAIYNMAVATENTQGGTWMYTSTQYTGLWGNPPYTTDAAFPAYVILC